MNAHRLAQGVDSLTARDDGEGVPRVLVSRHALDAVDRPDFVRRAALEGRSGGYGYVVARPGEAWSVETTAHEAAELESRLHTNHYLAPELESAADAGSVSSLERHARLTDALEQHPPRTPKEAMAILAEHARVCDGGDSATSSRWSASSSRAGCGWRPGTRRRRRSRRSTSPMWSSPLQYERLTWPEVRRAAERGAGRLIPVATLEDHGPHLPIDTDLRITAEICRRVAAALPTRRAAARRSRTATRRTTWTSRGRSRSAGTRSRATASTSARSLARHGFAGCCT